MTDMTMALKELMRKHELHIEQALQLVRPFYDYPAPKIVFMKSAVSQHIFL